MDRPRIYLDEDVYSGVALALRRRGFDVLTTHEVGKRGGSDEEQLAFAASKGMCFFTFNRGHFAEIHRTIISEGRHHYGIIVARQADLRTTVRTLCAFLSGRRAEDLRDQLI